MSNINTGRSLSTLNDHLFSTIEQICNPDINDEELEKAIKTSNTLIPLAETVISNAALSLKAEIFAATAQNNQQRLPTIFHGRIEGTEIKRLK